MLVEQLEVRLEKQNSAGHFEYVSRDRLWGSAGCRFLQLSPGTYKLSAKLAADPKLQIRGIPRIFTIGSGDELLIEFVIDGLGSLSGTARRGADRLTNEVLTILSREIRYTFKTDDQGRFSIRNVLPGEYVFRRGDLSYLQFVMKSNHSGDSHELGPDAVAASLAHLRHDMDAPSRECKIVAGENFFDPDFGPGGMVRIQVIRKDRNQPVSGARVHLYDKELLATTPATRPYRFNNNFPATGASVNRFGRTNSRGDVYFYGTGESHLKIHVTHPELQAKGVECDVHPDQDHELQIMLDEGFELIGQVADADGNIIEDAFAAASREDSTEPPLPGSSMYSFLPPVKSSRVDSTGRFVIKGLSNQRQTVYVWSPRHVPLALEVTPPLDKVNIVLSRFGGVNIQVRDTAGAPVMASARPEQDLVIKQIAPELWDMDVFFETVGNWIRYPGDSDTNGNIQFDRIIPGTLDIHIITKNAGVRPVESSVTVNVEPGKITKIQTVVDLRK